MNANSGGGFFSKEWLPLAKILERIPAKEPFTSRVFIPLFRGRSANTPGFLLAVLKSEGVVQRSTVNQRCWARGDLEGFNTKVAALVQAPLQSKAETKAGKAPVAGSKAPAGPRAVSKAVPAGKASPAMKRKQ